MKAYRVTFCGEVQGVGFRATVKRHALKLGLRGYARNLPDGCVEVVVVAENVDAVNALIDRLKSVRTARITSIKAEEVSLENPPDGFETY